MSNARSAQKCSTAPAVLEETPPAPAAQGIDWPDFLHDRIYFETEITREKDSVEDPDELMMKITGRVPVRLLTRFEYKMIVELEALLNEKAKGERA